MALTDAETRDHETLRLLNLLIDEKTQEAACRTRL